MKEIVSARIATIVDFFPFKNVKKFSKLHKKEIRGCGIKILNSEVKGSVDYAKIPQLKGINLERGTALPGAPAKR